MTRGSELVSLAYEQFGPRVRAHEQRFACRIADAHCHGRVASQVQGEVAVIIATVGRIETLDRCLASFARVSRERVEIIVVGNRPQERTRELVAGWTVRDPRIRYVKPSRARGPVRRPESRHRRDRG